MSSVRKVTLADGKTRYRVRVYVGVSEDLETGRLKRRYVTRTFDRKKDADAEASRLENAKRNLGGLTVPSKRTLAAYLTHWLDNVKAGQVRARTLSDYRAIVKLYVVRPPEGAPPIGAIRLDRLQGAAFEQLYGWLWRERGLEPRTVGLLHSILRQCLKHAVTSGDLAKNPTDGVKPPKKLPDGSTPKKRKSPMDLDEATAFLGVASDDRHSALWHVLLFGGLRPGEAFALKWNDVDLDSGRVHVRGSLTRRGIEVKKGSKEERWRVEPPKTNQARRSITLPEATVAALREWRTFQARERLLLGAEYQTHGFVFATQFGSPLDDANVRRWFVSLLKAAEVKPRRLYDLRHTCATLLLLAGENVKVVSERLGHKDVVLTMNTYQDVLPTMQESAAKKFDAMFG